MHPYIEIGSRQFPSYGLMMVLGIILSMSVGLLLCRKCYMRFADYFVICVSSIVCALLGAVLMYVLVTYPIAELWDRLIHARWDNFSAGYVFYGGLLGGVPGFFLGRKLTGVKLDPAIRTVVTVIPLGHAMGRVGCFLAGCCYGCEYDGPLAVTYPCSNIWCGAGTVPRAPVQLMEAALLLCLFGVLLILFMKRKKGYITLLTYAGCYSVLRFLLEFMRGDEIRGRAWIFSTAQWVSLVIFTAVAVSTAALLLYSRKHPLTTTLPESTLPEDWDDDDDDDDDASGTGAENAEE